MCICSANTGRASVTMKLSAAVHKVYTVFVDNTSKAVESYSTLLDIEIIGIK